MTIIPEIFAKDLKDIIFSKAYKNIARGVWMGQNIVVKLKDNLEDSIKEFEVVWNSKYIPICPYPFGIVKDGNLKGGIVFKNCGISLRKYLTNSDIDGNRRILLAKNIVLAIMMLHTEGLVHGDINDTNILVDYDERIYICDYETSSFEKQQSVSILSKRFAPPEILGGETQLRDISTDIYSLGVVLWNLLSNSTYLGHLDVDSIEFTNSILSEKSDDSSEIHKNFRPIILRCLSKEKLKRPSIVEVSEVFVRINFVREISRDNQRILEISDKTLVDEINSHLEKQVL